VANKKISVSSLLGLPPAIKRKGINGSLKGTINFAGQINVKKDLLVF